jgi:hypothetical protein
MGRFRLFSLWLASPVNTSPITIPAAAADVAVGALSVSDGVERRRELRRKGDDLGLPRSDPPDANPTSTFDDGLTGDVRIDPVNSGTVYVGVKGFGIYKSTDCGATWTKLNTALTTLAHRPDTIKPLWVSQSQRTTHPTRSEVRFPGRAARW